MNPLRIIVPVIILAVAGYGGYQLATNPVPPEKKKERPKKAMVVEVMRVEEAGYPVKVRTRGAVRPRTESNLISEVTGKIVKISPSFRDGGFFEAKDTLVEIDKLDYQTAVVVAEGELAQAASALEEEKARGLQALENWERLGRKGTPSSLTLRKPQLAEAEAREASARARLVKAERDLLRTEVKASYAGRVLRKEVDEGQVVTSGAILARVFAVDFAEIRLPLTDKQVGFVDLPEQFRGEKEGVSKPKPHVEIRGNVGGKEEVWEGKIVRVEGAIDAASRQLFVVAQVDDPYGRKRDGRPPLRVNMFVEAEITGRELENVFVLPRKAVRAAGEVIVVNEKNQLERRRVEPVWRDDDSIVVSAGSRMEAGEDAADPKVKVGLDVGEMVCLTPIPFAAEGVEVETREIAELGLRNADSESGEKKGGTLAEKEEGRVP